MTETPREESDQLPEEGPAGQVPDDGGAASREEAKESPGRAGRGGRDRYGQSGCRRADDSTES